MASLARLGLLGLPPALLLAPRQPRPAPAVCDEKLAVFKPTLPLATSNAIIERALACGQRHGFHPLTVVVLDAGGHVIAVQRQDGSAIMRPGVAEGKAYAALAMGMSTRLVRDRMASRPTFINALSDVSKGKFITTPGGVLVLDPRDGTVLGAVGISGDTSDKDELAAIEGIRSVGLLSEPAAPTGDWASSSLSGARK